MRMNCRAALVALGTALTLVAAPSGALAADAAAPDSTRPATPVADPTTAASSLTLLGDQTPSPERPRLVHPSPEGFVRVQRAQFQLDASSADSAFAAAKRRMAELDVALATKKKLIDQLNSRIKAAKQAKDDPSRTTLEAERKRQESMVEYFRSERDGYEAVADEAQARNDAARRGVEACELELQLTGRAGTPQFDADPSVFRLEQRWLEAMKAVATAQEKAASRRQSVYEKELKLYRGWADYLGGR